MDVGPGSDSWGITCVGLLCRNPPSHSGVHSSAERYLAGRFKGCLFEGEIDARPRIDSAGASDLVDSVIRHSIAESVGLAIPRSLILDS
jgi:hypothetical protein